MCVDLAVCGSSSVSVIKPRAREADGRLVAAARRRWPPSATRSAEYDGTASEVNAKRKSRPSRAISRRRSPASEDGPVPVVLAGRTDAGVHATGMVVHTDLHRRLDEAVLLSSLNATLDPLASAWSRRAGAPGPAHAQRQQLSRHVYRIQHGCGMADPHEVVERADACPALVRRGWLSVVRDRNRALCLRETLDVDAMLAAARTLACGAPRDFSALASQSGLAGAQPVRQLTELSVIDEVPDALSEHTRHGARGRSISVVARSRAFLKSQVRRMVACPSSVAVVPCRRRRSRSCSPLATQAVRHHPHRRMGSTLPM